MYHKTVLDNGIRVISEQIDSVRSVSIGVWVDCGSRDEVSECNGIAHFIEHMLFKGTRKRTALDIASQIDSVGGVINACTGKEITSLYIKIPDYHLSLAIDLLADLIGNSLFDRDEIEKERSVIFQEINLVEDTPDDCIHDFFGKIFWGGHPLGLPVSGTRESVLKIDRKSILEFFEAHYSGSNLVITAAGNLKHSELVQLASASFGKIRPQSLRPRRNGVPEFSSDMGILKKNLEQVHAILGVPAPNFASPSRYAGFLMNAVLGGGMSSRLFQEIREKRGLVYAIHSFLMSFSDYGMFAIYFGSDMDKLTDIFELILEELRRLQNHELTAKELSSAKEQIKGNFLLSMESTDNRMTRLAKNEIYFGRHILPEETLEKINSVEARDIRNLSRELFSPEKICAALIGKVENGKLIRDMIFSKGSVC